MEYLALWALARLLPPYSGEGDRHLARSLRRRFALFGFLIGLAVVVTVWDWTANGALTIGTAVVILIGLWLYSEHGDRPAA